jgi:hypothetical protein
MFGIGAFNVCRPCESSDPISDTVKVEPRFLMAEDKENCVPVQQSAEKQENRLPVLQSPEQKEVEGRAAEQAQRQERERELEATARLERERQETEAAEAEHQRRVLAAAERQARLEQELHEREQAEAEVLRQADEDRMLAAQAAEATRQREETAARADQAKEQKQLQAFMKVHGFTGVNFKRTRMMKSKYPLHSAVKHKDADMVRVLLKNGADPALKSSAGHTAQQLALKINKVGSHDLVLSALTPQ